MHKSHPIYIVLTIIAAGIALVVFTHGKKKNEELYVVADNRFYGKKLANNYYEFSILDYHRLIIQRKAHVLFFCSEETEACAEQDRILRDTLSTIKNNTVIVLYTKDKEFYQTFRAGFLTLVPFEKDGNQLPILSGLQNTQTVQALLEKL